MIEPDPVWHSKNHKHDGFFEFIGVISGKGHVKYNDQVYDATGPALFVFEPGRFHQEWSDPENPWRIVFLGGAVTAKRKLLLTVSSAKDVKSVVDIMMNIYVENVKRRLGWKHVVNGLFYGLIRRLVESEADTGGESTGVGPERKKEIAEKVKRYVEEHYNEKLSLKDLTEVVYLSPYYLSHTFKEETGYSPIQYVINRKMEIARKILADPGISISQTAKRVGYESIHYFSRLFTAIEGVSPTAYRKRFFKR